MDMGGFLSWGCGGRRGRGYTIRKSIGSYRLSIVSFALFMRFRDIAAFVLKHATFPHPTSSLPKISPCSPGSRWMAFGLQRVKANYPCNEFPRFPTYVLLIHPPTSQTDRQTDRQTDDMQSQYHALHYRPSASRGNFFKNPICRLEPMISRMHFKQWHMSAVPYKAIFMEYLHACSTNNINIYSHGELFEWVR